MDFNEHLMGNAIFWGAIVAIVFVTSFFGYRDRSSRHRVIETLAEKGQPIPPELLTNGRRSYSSRYAHPVASGIYLMCIGVGLAIFLWAMTGGGALLDGERSNHWLPFVGIFPFMVGLARVLAGVFDRPRSE
jgi:xanthine/uracil permease